MSKIKKRDICTECGCVKGEPYESRITVLEREQYTYHPWFKNELQRLEGQIVYFQDFINLSIWEMIRLKIKSWINK